MLNDIRRVGSRYHIIVIISTFIIIIFSVIITMMNNQVIGWDHPPITAPTSTSSTSNISYTSSEVMIQNNPCDGKLNYRSHLSIMKTFFLSVILPGGSPTLPTLQLTTLSVPHFPPLSLFQGLTQTNLPFPRFNSALSSVQFRQIFLFQGSTQPFP